MFDYENKPGLLWNSDTLSTSTLDSNKATHFVVRTNTTPVSYSFMAPSKTAVMLNPTSLSQPIRSVRIYNAGNTVLTYAPDMNDKEYKRLKKLGVIQYKRMLFNITDIIINNR